jgi:tetrahydromethanopterin S-methyltransferase subunit G
MTDEELERVAAAVAAMSAEKQPDPDWNSWIKNAAGLLSVAVVLIAAVAFPLELRSSIDSLDQSLGGLDSRMADRINTLGERFAKLENRIEEIDKEVDQTQRDALRAGADRFTATDHQRWIDREYRREIERIRDRLDETDRRLKELARDRGQGR